MGLNNDEKARFARIPNNDSVTFTSASLTGTLYTYDNTKWLTVLTAGANDTVLDSIYITTDDTIARTVHLAVYDTITLKLAHFNSFTVAIGSGTNTTAQPVNCLSTTNADAQPSTTNGKKMRRLKAGQKLVSMIPATPSSGKIIQVVANGLDFPAI